MDLNQNCLEVCLPGEKIQDSSFLILTVLTNVTVQHQSSYNEQLPVQSSFNLLLKTEKSFNLHF